MKTALYRARRLIWLWALLSAIVALHIVTGQDSVSFAQGLIHPNVWTAALVGLVCAAGASPVLTARWIRWYWGALIGLPLGIIILLLFFFARPHSWQPTRLDAWRSAGLFIGVYPGVIAGACLLAGGIGTMLICKGDNLQS